VFLVEMKVSYNVMHIYNIPKFVHVLKVLISLHYLPAAIPC